MTDTGITPEMMQLSNDTVDAEILKAIGEYADLDRQSSKITEKRSKIRERMEKKHGYSSLAFQEVVRKVKKMDAAEREAHEEMVARGLRVAGVLKQAELWPEEFKKAETRKTKAAERKAREEAKAATKTAEDIERGDPKRGGAGGANGRGKAKDAPAKPKRGSTAADRAEAAAERKKKLAEVQASSPGSSPGQVMGASAAQSDAALAESIAATQAQEQKDGAALLDNAGKPKSQSAIAAEIRDATGVDR